MSADLPNLFLEDITVRFGGLTAIDDATIRAGSGTITGLIGPNGAGKTTMFNACTGVVPLVSGRVALGSQRIEDLPTAKRAALGLGRTFQRMELFDSMTVAENVALGPEAFYSARRPWSQIVAPRSSRRHTLDQAEMAMEECGITHLSGRLVAYLSTGQRRLVELARAIATPFRFLLLDEPSSGLDVSETERFGEILTRYVAETGVGVLLVEHDMALVGKICSYIYVLDFGRLIFDGPTAETLESEVVRAAYLGSDEVQAVAEAQAQQLEESDAVAQGV